MGRGVGYYIRKSYRESVMDEPRCFWCGVDDNFDGAAFHVDHIVPPRIDGDSSRENLVKACVRCNASKSDRTLTNWLDHSWAKREKVRQTLTSYLWCLEKMKRRNSISSPEHKQRVIDKLQTMRREHSRLSRRIGTILKMVNG